MTLGRRFGAWRIGRFVGVALLCRHGFHGRWCSWGVTGYVRSRPPQAPIDGGPQPIKPSPMERKP